MCHNDPGFLSVAACSPLVSSFLSPNEGKRIPQKEASCSDVQIPAGSFPSARLIVFKPSSEP